MRNFAILHIGEVPMSTKRRILALLLLSLTVGAGPAWAVSFAYRDQARSEGGDVRVDLTPTSTTFCILSQFSVRDTDTYEELASCSIEEDAADGVWELRALMAEANDAEVFCEAICFNVD
jgi:hypothetical protein